MKKAAGIVIFLVIAILATTAIIFYASGYRPNLTDRNIQATGVVSIRSKPSEASVFIDGKSKGTTNVDLSSLQPGKYTVEITKEGFTSWQKEVEVKKEAVNVIEAVLFPVAPSLRALTFTGVVNPLASPNGSKVAFSVKEPPERAGIWVLNLSTSPLPSFFTRDLVQIVADSENFNFSSATYEFSPNGSQLLVKLAKSNTYFLLNVGDENPNPKEVTLDIDDIKTSWEDEKQAAVEKTLATFDDEGKMIADSLEALEFSPDEEKFVGRRKDGKYLIYDSNPGFAPDKEPKTYLVSSAKKYLWYPDNEHLVLVNGGSISVMDVDTTNNVTIYTEGFNNEFVVPWPDGSKIVITTNLNKSVREQPDLYAIELR
ncbi:MAG: PEGA domain-containing protein [Candidatus Woykebacteria bacterium]